MGKEEGRVSCSSQCFSAPNNNLRKTILLVINFFTVTEGYNINYKFLIKYLINHTIISDPYSVAISAFQRFNYRLYRNTKSLFQLCQNRDLKDSLLSLFKHFPYFLEERFTVLFGLWLKVWTVAEFL